MAYELQFGLGDRRIIEAFRGIGKSYITAAYCLWRLYLNPQVRILVVSANNDRAVNFTTFLKCLIDPLSGVPELRYLSPSSKQRQSSRAFDVALASADQTPSVRAMGITSQLAGSRADIIIADDIEVPNNSDTIVKRHGIVDRVKEFEAILKPEKGSEILYLGTPQTADSIYDVIQKILKEDDSGDKMYKTYIWPARYPSEIQQAYYGERLAKALRDELRDDPSLVGQPTDPIRFDSRELNKREATYGKSGFALQFMLDTSLSDVGKYPLRVSDLVVMNTSLTAGPDRIDWGSSSNLRIAELPHVAMDNDYYYSPINYNTEWVPYDGIVMSIDPSGRGSDETSYAVVASLGEYCFVLAAGGLNCQVGYGDEALGQLVEIAKKHKVNKIIVESNFGDGMFTGYLQKALMKAPYGCSIEEIKHSIQKEKRICDTLEPVINNHNLIINREVIEEDHETAVQWYIPEKSHQYMLLFQLTRITRDKGCLAHDDRLDALAMAVAYWVDKARSDNQVLARRRQSEAWEETLKKMGRNQLESYGGLEVDLGNDYHVGSY